MSGSSKKVQVSLPASITGFLDFFWTPWTVLGLFFFSWFFRFPLNCFWYLLHEWTLCGRRASVVPGLRACLSCVGRLCTKVPLWSNDVAAKRDTSDDLRVKWKTLQLRIITCYVGIESFGFQFMWTWIAFSEPLNYLLDSAVFLVQQCVGTCFQNKHLWCWFDSFLGGLVGHKTFEGKHVLMLKWTH